MDFRISFVRVDYTNLHIHMQIEELKNSGI